ncbi:formimidoylglutamate deiminase [Candidatus Foliamicus sp.]
MPELLFSKLLAPGGWLEDALVAFDSRGLITQVVSEVRHSSARRISGLAVPGMPNAHSHAHQRLLAGLAESGQASDSFARWRQQMHRMLQAIDPGRFQAVAALAYMEMLKSGYTSVAEFHYLHHAPGGLPYAQPAEMGQRCIAAAQQSGIALTILPSLYAHGGFNQAAGPQQSRFACGVDAYLDIFSALHKDTCGAPGMNIGYAPHSLRAVDETMMQRALEGAREIAPQAPVHIHVAEQKSEVEGCLAWRQARPLQFLLDRMDVDSSWHLVHATHANAVELRALARSGATVVLCPTTEANLGDGLFSIRAWLDMNGKIAIGSDSQITINPADELRLLEYAQRLLRESRNVLAAPGSASIGRSLLEGAAGGGAGSLAQPCGAVQEGSRADIVVLDEDHPALVARDGDQALDSWIFSGGAACVRDVFVGGKQVVEKGRHVNEQAILARYREAAESLLQ